MAENIRIGSGNLRGRTIKSPSSELTHPMGAREKMALFNMLLGKLPGAIVLDAFAGSGAIGIEALSRGAEKVVFIEKNPEIARNLTRNLCALGVFDQCKVVVADAEKFTTSDLFDIIIADPPYDRFDVAKVSRLGRFLASDGIMVVSHPAEAPEIDNLRLAKTKKYAAAHLSIYLK